MKVVAIIILALSLAGCWGPENSSTPAAPAPTTPSPSSTP